MSWDRVDSGGVETLEGSEPYGELGLFHANLAEFCAAEVPLAHALQSLDGDLMKGGLRDECVALARDLEAGVPFAQAYGQCGEHFPPVYRALVEAGVTSGDVAGVLREISIDASLRARVRDQLRRKLEYPMLAGLLVLALGIGLALFVPISIHDATAGYSIASGARVTSTVWVPGWRWIGIALVALLAILGLTYAALRKPLDPGAGPRGLRYRLPFVGRLRSFAAKAGFASTMALLLRRQLPLPHALRLCAAGVDGAEVRDQVERMAESADQGASLSQSLRTGDLVPPNLLWFVEAAGSAEASSRALADIAAIYRQRLQRATDRVATYATPVIELLIGFVVLLFALQYVQPAYMYINGVFGG